MKMLKLFLLLLLISNNSYGMIADYNTPEILARANVTDGFNIPTLSFLNNTSPVINNLGEVAFKITSIEANKNQGLWLKTAEDLVGKIVYTTPDDRFVTDPAINDTGKMTFSLFNEGVTDGLFIYDMKTFETTQALNPDKLPIQNYTYPQIFYNDHLSFRASDDNDIRSYYKFHDGHLEKILAEGVDNLGIKSSYLFRPSFNQSGQLAFKARIGDIGKLDEGTPDSIFLLTPTTDSKNKKMKAVSIAYDQDTQVESSYLSFGNSLSLSNNGLVSFIAVLANSKKAIVVSKENILVNFAVEGENDILEIEMFTPKINEQGLVLFRAYDLSGKRGLYLADGASLKRIIGEGDEINTDLGQGKILFNPNYPGISGDVDMNDQGEIVFHCLIVSTDDEELGSAIYKITPIKK